MTTIVLKHNDFTQSHLDKIVEEMKVLGAPAIRCYDLGFDNLVQAIEGCHRLRACEILGYIPELIYIDSEEKIEDLDDLDDDNIGNIDSIGDWENYSIDLDYLV